MATTATESKPFCSNNVVNAFRLNKCYFDWTDNYYPYYDDMRKLLTDEFLQAWLRFCSKGIALAHKRGGDYAMARMNRLARRQVRPAGAYMAVTEQQCCFDILMAAWSAECDREENSIGRLL